MSRPRIIETPKRHVIVLNAKVNPTKEHLGQMYNIQPNMILQNEYPTLITISTIHRVETLRPMIVPYVLVNLSNDSIFLPKGELLGSLESMMSTEAEENQNTEVGEVEKKFITSPADVEVHRRVNLQNVKVTEEDLQKFKKLCEEYDDIFSKDSTDIGRTPSSWKLI